MSSLEKCLYKSFIKFLVGLFVFVSLSCRSFSYRYILDLTSYQIYSFQIFSPIQLLPFHSVVYSLKSHYLFIFAFVACTLSVMSKKSLPRPMLWSFTIMFPFKSFIVSGLTFNSFIHVELIFVCGVRWVQFYSFVCGYPAFPTAFVKEIFFFSHCVVKDREAWHAAVHGVAESDWSWRLNNNSLSTLVNYYLIAFP